MAVTSFMYTCKQSEYTSHMYTQTDCHYNPCSVKDVIANKGFYALCIGYVYDVCANVFFNKNIRYTFQRKILINIFLSNTTSKLYIGILHHN